MPLFVYIEGNIAAGKSTLLRELHLQGYACCEEDISSFAEQLATFYDNPSQEAALALQLSVIRSCRAQQQYARDSGADVIFVERSCFSSWAIFAEFYHHVGLLTRRDVELLRSEAEDRNGVVVYLRTQPSHCIARAQGRNRREETNLNDTTILQLHEWHERALATRPDHVSAVIVVDGENAPCDVARQVLAAITGSAAAAEDAVQ